MNGTLSIRMSRDLPGILLGLVLLLTPSCTHAGIVGRL
jgi:hypothetical protein